MGEVVIQHPSCRRSMLNLGIRCSVLILPCMPMEDLRFLPQDMDVKHVGVWCQPIFVYVTCLDQCNIS